MLGELPFHAGQDLGGLPRVAARTHAQVHVGPGQAELGEENLGHPFVIVLAGVHDPLLMSERRQGADHRRGLHEVRPRPEHVRDGCAHRILSVHLDPLPSAAVTTSHARPSPRALSLAASIGWRHAAADPVRALLLAWRVLPVPLRRWLRFAGPYGRATALWGAGERDAALAVLAAAPRRLAAFSLAADQPAMAAAALGRLARDDRACPVLAARLAWSEGRLTEALRALDGARGLPARRLRATLTAEHAALAPGDQSMIMASSGRIATETGHDHEAGRGGRLAGSAEPVPGRVLHLVTDALPTTSAGYTIRTHEIALAQRAAGLDPQVATRCGYPVTQGVLDGRRLVLVDGVPYHRLLPWSMPGLGVRADADPKTADLTRQIRPAVLHAAGNFANARL